MNTSNQSPCIADIRQRLRADIAAGTELLDLLRAEREALVERKMNELVEIIEAKARVLDQIDAQAQERLELLRQWQLPATEHAWRTLVQDCDDGALGEDWQALTDCLHECRRYNEVNGRMIARSKQTLGKLLTLLRGQNLNADLYDAQGESQGQYSPHTVIKV